MRNRSVFCSIGLVAAVGCASAGASRGTTAASTPERTSEAASAQVDLKPSFELRAVAPGDLEVDVEGPRYVGAVSEAAVHEYAMRLSVRNQTRAALELGPTVALVEVFEGTTQVPGCESETAVGELPATLAPSAVVMTTLRLPCALPEEGSYDVVVTLATGRQSDEAVSVHDVRFAASMPLEVVDDVAPFGASAMPTARIYGPEPSMLATPVPTDVRPEPEPEIGARPTLPSGEGVDPGER